jgi:hypothetical protein
MKSLILLIGTVLSEADAGKYIPEAGEPFPLLINLISQLVQDGEMTLDPQTYFRHRSRPLPSSCHHRASGLLTEILLASFP